MKWTIPIALVPVLFLSSFLFPYTLRKGDVLRIEVLGYPELTRDCAVDVEGNITFPYVGRVKVEGLSIDQTCELLRDRLSKYLTQPQVFVTFLQIAPRNVYVSGVVNMVVNMGVQDLTISKLIASLGIDLSNVDLSKVKLVRGGRVSEIDLSGLLHGELPKNDVVLMENDQIVLPEKSYEAFVKVIGAVRNPGIYPYKKNMTLLDAISLAGGTTPESSGKIVLISDTMRELSEREVFERLVLLKPGDTVHVQKVEERFAYIVGAVLRPGAYTFSKEEPLTLKNLVAKAGGLSQSEDFVEKVVIVRDGKAYQEFDVKVLNEYVELRVGDVVEVKGYEKTEVFLSGFVNFPGVYRISPKRTYTFLELLSMAGGFKGSVENVDRIVVNREGREIVYLPDELNFTVLPGDVVRVEEYTPKRAYVLGLVRNPGLYVFGKRESFNLKNLIAKAGGVVDERAVLRVRVGDRYYSFEEILREEIPLVDGVFVYVERTPERFVYLVGDNVSRNGRMDFDRTEPFTVSTALKKYGIEDFALVKRLSLIRGGREEVLDPMKIAKSDVELEVGDTLVVRLVQERRVYFTGDVYGYVTFGKEEEMDLEKALAKFGRIERKYVRELKVYSSTGVRSFAGVSSFPLNDGDVVEVSLKKTVRVYVDGFVKVPGRVSFEPDERVTLDLAIVKAGSYKDSALFEPKDVQVFRDNWLLTIPLDQTRNFELMDNDFVFVRWKEKTHVYVFGEGVNNALVTFEKEETPNLRNVLSKVGGVKPSASRKIVLVSPSGEKREVLYEDAMNTGGPVLESGTVVFVPVETENFVYVVGEVARPGAYQLVGDITLVKLIAQAGGLSNWASRTRIVLRRQNEEYVYDFSDMSKVQEVRLQAGDIVYVPPIETNIVYVLGSVRNPGIVRVDRYSTVFDAVMRAGGLTQSAAPSRIFLFRGGLEGEVVICDLSGILSGKGVGVNPDVSPGDVIYVPNNPLAQLSEVIPIVRDVLGLIGTVKGLMGW